MVSLLLPISPCLFSLLLSRYHKRRTCFQVCFEGGTETPIPRNHCRCLISQQQRYFFTLRHCLGQMQTSMDELVRLKMEPFHFDVESREATHASRGTRQRAQTSSKGMQTLRPLSNDRRNAEKNRKRGE